MKKENIRQDVKQRTASVCQPAELEYINSLLDINSKTAHQGEDNSEIILHEQESKPGELAFNRYTDTTCKVFSQAGLNFAVPLTSTETLLQNCKIKPVDSENALHIGNTTYNDRQIRVIDLTCLIVNSEHENACVSPPLDGTAHLVLLKGTAVGIACEDDMGEQMILQQQVCWRNAASNRLWLAGTVREKGLSLLDLEGLLNLLNNKS